MASWDSVVTRLLMIMKTRITEPKPQHRQSRKESEKVEIGLRAILSPIEPAQQLVPLAAVGNLIDVEIVPDR